MLFFSINIKKNYRNLTERWQTEVNWNSKKNIEINRRQLDSIFLLSYQNRKTENTRQMWMYIQSPSVLSWNKWIKLLVAFLWTWCTFIGTILIQDPKIILHIATIIKYLCSCHVNNVCFLCTVFTPESQRMLPSKESKQLRISTTFLSSAAFYMHVYCEQTMYKTHILTFFLLDFLFHIFSHLYFTKGIPGSTDN